MTAIDTGSALRAARPRPVVNLSRGCDGADRWWSALRRAAHSAGRRPQSGRAARQWVNLAQHLGEVEVEVGVAPSHTSTAGPCILTVRDRSSVWGADSRYLVRRCGI